MFDFAVQRRFNPETWLTMQAQVPLSHCRHISLPDMPPAGYMLMFTPPMNVALGIG